MICICMIQFTGVKNVIDACLRCKAKRLIYTSSPSVVFDGIHGIFNADESMPYPDKVRFLMDYILLVVTGSHLFPSSLTRFFLTPV
jgi:nucleoside-diphosphate-sugar epimerase